MKTYSTEEGLTEEALVTKLRICQYHHLYLHTSLRNNSSGSISVPEFPFFEITIRKLLLLLLLLLFIFLLFFTIHCVNWELIPMFLSICN
jgi:hypothetical protein